METRDILNHLGVKIGELSLEDGTSEEEWSSRLAAYAEPPKDPVIEEIKLTVKRGKEIAEEVMETFKKNNILRFAAQGVSNEMALMKSIWVHHRLRAVEVNLGLGPRVVDLMNLCISGDIETAYILLQYMTPDDMSQPDHFLSEEVIDELKDLIGAYL